MESGPANLYKKTIFGTQLSETIEELKASGCPLPPQLEKKILLKFDEIMCNEISKLPKNKNTIRGKVTSFRNCDDVWIFYCKDVDLRIDKENITMQKLKIVALDEKLRKKGEKETNYKYSSNEVGEG